MVLVLVYLVNFIKYLLHKEARHTFGRLISYFFYCSGQNLTEAVLRRNNYLAPNLRGYSLSELEIVNLGTLHTAVEPCGVVSYILVD